MKKLLLTIVVFSLLFALAACGQDDAGEFTLQEGVLIMATNAEFPPFEFMTPDGDIVGFDIDMAYAIAEELGLELRIDNMDFDAIIETVVSGRADVAIAGLTVTEVRLREVNFTTTYHNATQVIIVPIGSDISGRNDLDGRSVGVQTGTTGELWMLTGGSNASIQSYSSPVDAIRDLTLGRLDAVVIDENPAQVFVDMHSTELIILDEPLTEEAYAIAVNINNTALLEAINGVLANMEADGRMDAIRAEWGLLEADVY
jgi:polar amino acid transport system substrate-binding protein